MSAFLRVLVLKLFNLLSFGFVNSSDLLLGSVELVGVLFFQAVKMTFELRSDAVNLFVSLLFDVLTFLRVLVLGLLEVVSVSLLVLSNFSLQKRDSVMKVVQLLFVLLM